MGAAPYARSARADAETEQRLSDLVRQLSRASHGGMREEALRLASEYRDVCLATFGRSHFRFASALNALGLVHKNRGEVALAIGAYSKALALLGQSEEGRASPSWAAVAANTGACYRAMADGARSEWERLQLLENAGAYLTEALRVRRDALGPGSDAVGETLSLLTGVLRAAEGAGSTAAQDAEGRDEGGGSGSGGGDGRHLMRAEAAARRAVQLLEDGSGSTNSSPRLATALANLAVVLLQPLPQAVAPAGVQEAQAWRASEATALLRRAIAIRRETIGQLHPDTIEAMLALSRAVAAAAPGSQAAEAEARSIRSTADSLYDELRALQEQDAAKARS